MFGADQNMTVAQSGIALQAARDITVHMGVSLTQVHETFALLFEHNVPRLKEIANQAAEENVRKLEAKFVAELARATTPISIDKLGDPDVQMAFNDAIRAAARRGEAANLDTLAKLLTHRMAQSTKPFVEVVISEAIQAVPKLTNEQMAFLAFIFTVRSVSPSNAPVQDLERLGQAVWPLLIKGFGLSKIQRSHLQYAGALSIVSLLDGSVVLGDDHTESIYGQLYMKYRQNWGLTSTVQLKSTLEKNAPTYFEITKRWGAENGQQCELTSVGSAIGLAMLMPVVPFPGMNFEQWLA